MLESSGISIFYTFLSHFTRNESEKIAPIKGVNVKGEWYV